MSSDKRAQAQKRFATCPLCPVPRCLKAVQFPAHFKTQHNGAETVAMAKAKLQRLQLVYLARARGYVSNEVF